MIQVRDMRYIRDIRYKSCITYVTHVTYVTYVTHVAQSAQWLHDHAPWLVPMVNQVSPGPEALYRSLLFINAPEQYPAASKPACVNGSCAALNVTLVALKQMEVRCNDL